MDETIPELQPLPKEVTRRRWWPFRRRSRDCRVRVVLEQMRFKSDRIYPVYPSSEPWRVVVAVGEACEERESMLARRDVETYGFVHDLARPGRCGTEIEMTYTLMVELVGKAASDTLPRYAETVQKRRYRCPGYVDDEPFTLRATDPSFPDSFWQFDFQFRVELGCS
ncbi:MAG TPA: hypothetical protein VLW85_01920 [Myxococcales bacterium]|nr:hypothetical protein [Myxococcales bacterium]